MNSTQPAHHELKASSVALITLGIGALELNCNGLAYDTPGPRRIIRVLG
jgi:hypothetical protein